MSKSSPPSSSAYASNGYVLLVRRSMGRGTAPQPELHRRAQGSTGVEAVIEAEALEKSLNGGLTFAEAEAAQIQNARERRDPLVTANLKQGAYLVAVQTLHGASQMPGFDVWSKRTTQSKAPVKRSPKRSRQFVP